MLPLRVLPYRSIAAEVAERLASSRAGLDPLAPWSEEVIVPSRGMADAIAGELLRHLPAGAAGLQIRTIDAFALRLLNEAGEFPRIADESERRMAMRRAARNLPVTIRESRGVASLVERSWRDIRDSGVTLTDFSRRSRGAKGLRSTARIESLITTWREYDRLIALLDAVDPADVLLRATRFAERARPQLLAGFYDMTGVQLALVEALDRAGRLAAAWIPSSAEFAQPLIQALAPAGEAGLMEPVPRTELLAHRYDRPDDEIRGVCAQVAALLKNGAQPADIGIVARSLEPYDEEMLRRFAREAGFRTTLSDDIPLPAHRIGRGALTLLRLRDRGWLRADVLELVRDGLIVPGVRIDPESADFELRRLGIAAGSREELDRFAERIGTRDYLTLLEALEELTTSIDLPFLQRLPGLFRIETERDLAAAEALEEAVRVAQRTAVWGGPLDTVAVAETIERSTVPCARSADASLPLIWTGDVMRFRGRTFRHLFVVRAEEGLFPQRRLEDALLPDGDRMRLGIRAIGDGRREEELLFSLMCDAATERVVFSHATTDAVGALRRPSRFLRALQVTAAPAFERPALTGDASPRQRQLLKARGSHSLFDGHIGTISEEIAARVAAVSPSQLDDFGECPHKFFLKHVLKIRDFENPEDEIQMSARDKGSLDHEILERFYRATSVEEIREAAGPVPRLPDASRARLERTIDEAFDELEAKRPIPNRAIRDIERRTTKRVLAEFLANDFADLNAAALEPHKFEYSFGSKYENADHPEAFVKELTSGTVTIDGKVDRIDRAQDGRLRIVDYKSGTAYRHKGLEQQIDSGVRLQLALYAIAIAHIFSATPEKVSGTVKPLATKGGSSFGFELQDVREKLEETLTIFLRAMHEGDYPAFPAEKVGACNYCLVRLSCHARFDVYAKREAEAFGTARGLLERND